ncbi:MAG: oligosaccharide flippase family protein [Bacteroidota bacterium]|nr:oligosaccharide flippase family protein [Bacteroidota bacterium]
MIIHKKDRKQLTSNFLSLSTFQIINSLIPLITLPYLLRILGVNYFGLIVFAQSFIMFFNIITDYGFNFSATREIAKNINNKEKVSLIFSTVMFIKLILFFLSFLLLSIIIFSFNHFRSDWLIYYLTFGIVFGQTLFPIWFFQGIEKMRHIAVLNFVAKTFFLFAIFLFIHKESDYIYVPLINSAGFIISGILGLLLAFRTYKIKILIPDFTYTKHLFYESTYLFISSLSTSLFSTTTNFLLGIMTNNHILGIYAAMEKIILGVKGLFGPLLQTLFPWVSKKENKEIHRLIKRMIVYAFIIGSSAFMFLFVFSEDIINILYSSSDIMSYIVVFKILTLALILAPLGLLFTSLYLTAIKAYKIKMQILIVCGFLNVLTVIVLTYYYSIYGTAFSVLLTEFILLFFGILYFIKLDKRI